MFLKTVIYTYSVEGEHPNIRVTTNTDNGVNRSNKIMLSTAAVIKFFSVSIKENLNCHVHIRYYVAKDHKCILWFQWLLVKGNGSIQR